MFLGLAACERDSSPQLIRVDDLVPREAEVGGTLEIRGEGFPQGRAAHVRFRGMLHRPGETAVSTEIEAMGTATLPTEVDVAFDEELESRFCGVGKRAMHTTFSGEVEVAFSPALEGAPPVAGSTATVTLDVRPPVRAMAGEKEDGLRTLAVLGIRVDPAAKSDRGIAVASVDDGSRAHAAGISAGDVLVSWAGVRLGSIADVALASGAPSVRVGLRRGESPALQAHDIETAGVSANGSVDASLAVLLLALALGLVFGFAASRPAWVVRLEARMARAPRLLPNAMEAFALSAAALVPWIAFAATRADLDVVLALLAASAAFVATAVVTGGFRAAGRAVTMMVPLALASAIAMFGTGALRIDDAVRAQGVWPWEWQAARDPAALVLLVLATAALAGNAGSSRALQLAQRATTGFAAGMLAALLLGGGAGAAGIVGGLEHLAKAWIVIAAAHTIRAAGPVRAAIVWRRIVPAGLAAACLSIATAELAPASAAPYLLAASAAAIPILLGVLARVVRARLSGGDAAWAPSALQ
jgi:hypothetical protein